MKTIVIKLAATLMLTFFFIGEVRAQDKNSSECIRAKPARILSNRVFPKTTFKLTKNKSFPFEYVGFETARLKNGDLLTVKNYGCENYSLDFRFETKRFSGNLNRAKFWYRAAVQLMNSVNAGLRKDEFLPVSGTQALRSSIRKNRTLRFDEIIDFGGTDIRSVVSVPSVRKSKNGKYIVEISFGIGPL